MLHYFFEHFSRLPVNIGIRFGFFFTANLLILRIDYVVSGYHHFIVPTIYLYELICNTILYFFDANYSVIRYLDFVKNFKIAWHITLRYN